MKLFLWRLSQEVNNEYDTYDSAIVVATCQGWAREIHPAGVNSDGERFFVWMTTTDCPEGEWHWGCDLMVKGHDDWAKPDQVEVRCVGLAAEDLVEGQVICASFNAG